VSNVLDISSYADVTIKCNRANEFQQFPTDCSVPKDLEGLPYRIPSIRHSGELILLVAVVNIVGHLWIVVIAVGFVILAGYKFLNGSNEYDDPPPSSSVLHLQSFYSETRPNLNNYSVVDNRFDLLKNIEPEKSRRKFSFCLKSSTSEEQVDGANFQKGFKNYF
jgi:hypothetical protein